MTGKERTSKAIHGKNLDRFPIFPILLAPACHLTGVKQRNFFKDADILANTLLSAQKLFDFDGIYVSRDNWVYHEALGGSLNFPEDDETFSKQTVLSNIGEFKKLSIPDPWHAPGMKTVLEAASKIVESAGDTLYIQANIDTGPFSLAAVLRGAQNFIFELYDEDPSLLAEFMEFCTEVVITYGKAMIGTGVHGIQMGEATASLLNKDLFASYVVPYLEKVLKSLEFPGCDRWVHVCGKTDHLLEELNKLPMEGLEIDSPTDMAIARRIIHSGIALKGNLNTSTLLMDTPTVVYEKAMQILKSYPSKTGLVFSAGCGVPKMTPKENLMAMAKACRDYNLE
jgi:MtaA/CmuA family methyltransferase